MKGLLERIKAAWKAFKNPELLEQIDELTGLYLRKSFIEKAKILMAKAKREKQPVSLIFIDVNNLKNLNDTQGHKAGDGLLKSLAEILKKHLRPYDLLCRWGGDEFVILLSNTNYYQAEKIAQRIFFVFPKFSFGISSWDGEESIENLVEKADKRMYRMKTK